MRYFQARRWPGIEMVLGFALAAMTWLPIWPQQTATPVLHHRAQGAQEEGAGSAADNRGLIRGFTTLPSDVWGAYEFEHSSDTIEIDLDRHKLSGYISRLGDAETDSNTPLTFFFDQSSINGNEISFETRVVHGVWYSFRGTIVRGNGKARADEGYYVLHGILELHHPQNGRDKDANETFESHVVNFKSVPQ